MRLTDNEQALMDQDSGRALDMQARIDRLPSNIIEACGQVRDRDDVVELVERVSASLRADLVKITADRDDWTQAANSWMDTALSLRDNITKARVERDKARDALSKLIEAFVNPHDGAPFEDGEVPALDHARNVINRTTSNG